MPFDAGSANDGPAVATHFDGLYAASERYWWRHGPRYSTNPSDYPHSLLTQLTLRVIQDRRPAREPARALDLGAGEGADSIRLALLGYQVTAVEISQVAADKIRRFAAEAGVSVNVKVSDLSRYRPDDEFDLIICNGVLHYIADKEAVIMQTQAATRPGGLNVMSAWSSYTPVPPSHNSIPVYCDDEDGVLARCYSTWNMKIFYLERNKPESAHIGMPPHAHSHIKMIAEKPV